MLRRRHISSVGLSVATTIAMVACGSAALRLPEAKPAATVLSTPQTPPPMPSGVTHPPTLLALHSGSGTYSCSTDPLAPQGHVGIINWDPTPTWPRSPSDLYRRADLVLLATAVETRGFWQKDDGHLPAQNLSSFDWASFTATNLRIDAVYKGATRLHLVSLGGWLQVIDSGADPASLTTCQNRAAQRAGWPQPIAGGQQYLLFLNAAPDGLHEWEGPADRWPVIRGVVHPDHDLQPSAYQSVPGAAMPLDQFIAAMQRP